MLITQTRAHKNGRLVRVWAEFSASTKNRSVVTCTHSNINILRSLCMCVTIFSTSGKFHPVSILRSYTLLLQSPVLMCSLARKYTYLHKNRVQIQEKLCVHVVSFRTPDPLSAFWRGSGNETTCALRDCPANDSSGYSAVLMCMLHESLVCVWSVFKHEEPAWETCAWIPQQRKGMHGVSLGRPLATGVWCQSGRPVSTTVEGRSMVLFLRDLWVPQQIGGVWCQPGGVLVCQLLTDNLLRVILFKTANCDSQEQCHVCLGSHFTKPCMLAMCGYEQNYQLASM